MYIFRFKKLLIEIRLVGSIQLFNNAMVSGRDNKTRRLLSRFSLICVCFLVASCPESCEPAKHDILDLKLIPQHRDGWCWAASTESISQYFGHTISQQSSVQYVYNDSCGSCFMGCDCWGSAYGAKADKIKQNWSHWHFSYSYKDSAIEWGDLQRMINYLKSPIQAFLSCDMHIVSISGYMEKGYCPEDKPDYVALHNYVYYWDPWPPDCEKIGYFCNPLSSGGDYAANTYEGLKYSDGCYHPYNKTNWSESLYNFQYQN